MTTGHHLVIKLCNAQNNLWVVIQRYAGYGRSIVLPTLWGASYGHHLHHHKRWPNHHHPSTNSATTNDLVKRTTLQHDLTHFRAAQPEPHHGYNRYGFRGYRGWYGRRKRSFWEKFQWKSCILIKIFFTLFDFSCLSPLSLISFINRQRTNMYFW